MHLCEFWPLGCRTAANRLTVETRSGPRSRLRRALSLANEEHVDRLKQDVEAWNAWREENPDIRPDLLEADLSGATLIETNFTGADLTNCWIYGVSAWELKLERAKQQNLIITPLNDPKITVDNIEVAQFI